MIKMQVKFTILLLVAALYVASAQDIDVTVKHECPTNEEWVVCGGICEPTCAIPIPKFENCADFACTPRTAACRCISGYVRDTDGSLKCIESQDCS